jgi:hypothetical protein
MEVLANSTTVVAGAAAIQSLTLSRQCYPQAEKAFISLPLA